MVLQVLVAELVDSPDLAQHEAPFVGIGEEGCEIVRESVSEGEVGPCEGVGPPGGAAEGRGQSNGESGGPEGKGIHECPYGEREMFHRVVRTRWSAMGENQAIRAQSGHDVEAGESETGCDGCDRDQLAKRAVVLGE